MGCASHSKNNKDNSNCVNIELLTSEALETQLKLLSETSVLIPKNSEPISDIQMDNDVVASCSSSFTLLPSSLGNGSGVT